MIISLVAAAAENNVIGKDNRLLWHLPNDLKFFKNTTWGMPVIMGRKTFESFHSKPLPGRFNVVITRHPEAIPTEDGHLRAAASLAEAVAIAGETDAKEIFVIGGGQIYSEALPMANRIYLTRVHASPEGDAWFPELDPSQWKLLSELDFPVDDRHAYAYSFQVWGKS